MAETKDIKVYLCTIADYLEGNESIAYVLMRAFQDYSPTIFTRLCLDETKQRVIKRADNLWKKAFKASETINDCEIYKKIKSVNDEIVKAQSVLISSGNWLEKIVCRWKLFKYGFYTIPAEELLAMHICKYGNNSSEHDKFIALLDEDIVTYDEIAPLFEASRIRQMRPLSWPQPQGKFFSVEEVPYLQKLVNLAMVKEYTRDEMIQSWNEMKKMKRQQKPCKDWDGFLDLSEALYVMFSSRSYEYIKKHHVAFLVMIDND